MNAQKKKSAVKKYVDLKNEGKTKEELIALLNADEKGFTSDEVVEIITDVMADFGPAGNKSDEKKKKKSDDITGTLNVVYEEWKVKPVYKEIKDELGNVKGRKLTGYEKDAKDPIRTTSITQDKAELLNQQSENTLVRLYEK
jgi:hypothetical protein